MKFEQIIRGNSMLKHRSITLDRLQKFISSEYFTDVNLYGKLYGERRDVNISVYSVPNGDRIPYEEAIKQQYKTTKIGTSFGPSWYTHWFRIEATIPQEWKGKEVHFIWDSDSEALVYQDDIPQQGLTGGNGWDRRVEYYLFKSAQGGEKVVLYVEMACNGMFGNGLNGQINPPDPNRMFTLKTCELRVFDREAFELYMDFKIIAEMAKELPEESQRGRQALYVANEMINRCDTSDRSTWKECRALAAEFLSQKNGDSQHQIIATGHCHIDVAWLWPYAETKRKAARSFATQMRLMDLYPFYKFSQSQAQLYDWIKQLYPKLWTKLKQKVKEGRFIPVGGTWVEMCGNLPGGESMVRQFLFGQRFFKKEFGFYCTEFWLPDSFGYSGQLPQIMKGAKIDSFVTQKLSWNTINKFPNSTFIWEGIDGTQVFAHFPPADTYNAMVLVRELLFNVENFKDKERSNTSLMLFGHGDGGGGANVDMLERLKRIENVDGLPKVKTQTAKDFFDVVKQDHQKKGLHKWIGELYFELHRGIYTSQAATKRGNRLCEFLLRDIEFYSLLAEKASKLQYPRSELDKMWKLVLINQFHDVIPGSSIEMVYKDALEYYNEVLKIGEIIKNRAIKGLLNISEEEKDTAEVFALNSLNWERKEVVELPQGFKSIQKSRTGKPIALVSAPSLGFRRNGTVTNVSQQVKVTTNNDNIVMENDYVKVTIFKNGTISVYDKRVDSVTIKDANQFVLYDDVPMFWDAWDVEVYHLEKKKLINNVTHMKVVEGGPLRSAVEIHTKLTNTSSIKQVISLTAVSPRIDFDTEVDWVDERHIMLKVQFPTTVQSTNATFEVQYGHLQRPTHYNTSWDIARFEVLGHKWIDLSEYGYGVALLNDCKYGHSVQGGVMHLSLLRSPKAPDGNCDMGHHVFKYALFPHTGTFQDAGVIQEAYNLNSPLTIIPAQSNYTEKSFFTVDKKNVIVEVVKKAEDSEDTIVRLYEAFGGKANVTLKSNSLPIKMATLCNMLEEDQDKLVVENGSVKFAIKPFQILTIKLIQ